MKNFFKSPRLMTAGAMLAAIAAVLMFLDFPVPFLPSFYKIDFSEIPVLIGAYAMGPVAGVIIEAFKILIKFLIKGTVTAGIGELANFLIGLSFILPASIIYQVKKTKKSALVGLCIAAVCNIVAGCLLNAYLLVPAYAKAFGGMERVIGGAAKANSSITGMTTLILFGTIPLNVIKSVIASVIVILIYKPLSRVIKGFNTENKK